jgi:type 1 glutamine amidotransferase
MWPEKIQKTLENYVKMGGGLYILHSANNAFANWPEYNLMIGLGWRTPEEGVALQVTDNGEIKVIPAGEGKGTYHGPRNDEVITILTQHPINRGFPNAWLTPDMELYKFARGPAKNLTVISYAKDDETGINWPVEWTVVYGKGRVYNSSMGHLWKGDIYPPGYRCIGFQTTMIRATEWLAKGKTTYAVPKDFPTKNMVSLKEELINE